MNFTVNNTAKMQTIGQCTKIHRPVGRFSSTRNIKYRAESGKFERHYI